MTKRRRSSKRKIKTPIVPLTGDTACVDRISNLPVDIIRKILDLVPLKDAAKTSVLSQRWLSIWDSRPDIHLDESLFRIEEYDSDEWTAAFQTYMRKSLDRRKSKYNSCVVDKLFLQMTLFENTSAELLVKEWIHFALQNNVHTLHLTLKRRYDSYFLHNIAFVATTLVKLYIKDCDLQNCSFVLPTLRSLFLCSVRMKCDHFRDLIAGCPRLERFCLEDAAEFCLEEAYTVVVSSPTLKFFGMYDSRFNGKVQIESTNLECLELVGIWNDVCEVEICSTRIVKSLIVGDYSHHVRKLTHFINQFPLLEKLILCRWFVPDEIEEIRIDAPKLKSLEYFGRLTYFPGIIASSQELEFLKFHLEPTGLNSSWYIWLRDSLESFAHCKHLSLVCRNKTHIIFPDELKERLLPTINDLKHLELQITDGSATSQEILDGFIWILPGLKTLSLTLGSISELIEFPQRG